MNDLREATGWALLATVPVVLAHELMHGFGGALFGQGADLYLNGASPAGTGLTGTTQWVVFALSGTAYLFYLAVALLLAFAKWKGPHLLGIALAAGTLHQVGFFHDLLAVVSTGSTGTGTPTDPFHAAAILWNGGPLSRPEQPWREIVCCSGWPSFLVMAVLAATLALWACFGWVIAGMLVHCAWLHACVVWLRTLMTLALVPVIAFAAFVLSSIYAVLAGATGWGWSAPPTALLALGAVLLGIPLIVWARGCPLPRSIPR